MRSACPAVLRTLLLVFGLSGAALGQEAQVETAVVEESSEIDRELEELESEERELSDRRRRIEERRLELESQREETAEEEDSDSVRRRRAEQKFSVGSTLKVRRGEISRDALAMGGGVKIDGEVFGNAVAMGGGIKVEGRVTGDVIAVGENVELGEDSEVLGDVVSVGGEVEREEGAVVLGEIREVDFIDQIPNFGDFTWWDAAGRTSRGFGSFVRSVLVALFGSAFVLIASMVMRVVAPRQLDRVQSAAGREFWMAAFVGLMIQLLTLPMLLAITLLLVISIIGIPFLVLIPFFFLAFCIVALVGYAGVAQGVGSWMAGRLGMTLRGGLFTLLRGSRRDSVDRLLRRLPVGGGNALHHHRPGGVDRLPGEVRRLDRGPRCRRHRPLRLEYDVATPAVRALRTRPDAQEEARR